MDANFFSPGLPHVFLCLWDIVEFTCLSFVVSLTSQSHPTCEGGLLVNSSWTRAVVCTLMLV